MAYLYYLIENTSVVFVFVLFGIWLVGIFLSPQTHFTDRRRSFITFTLLSANIPLLLKLIEVSLLL